MENQSKLIELDPVFPSKEITVFAHPDQDYGGAHRYEFINSLGHIDGKPLYDNTRQTIAFVKKEEEGMKAGLQSEQLLIALIDRHKKLNAKFPSDDGERMIAHLEAALECLADRVRDRIKRGVMGELKK